LKSGEELCFHRGMGKTRSTAVASSEQRAKDAEAVRHFKQSLESGESWYPALLESMALWASPEEVHRGRHYRYLIDGEAFDWLLLSERLCQEVDGIPEEEKKALLYSSRPPVEVSRDTFRRLLGHSKYRAYLNYFYGVVVEEALLSEMEAEVMKEQLVRGVRAELAVTEEAYRRLYGEGQEALLRLFFKDRRRRYKKTIGLEEWKEFTYWLFKYRLRHSERARVASDTRKGLSWLHRQWGERRPPLL
jgi:hypothetical protein